MQNSKINNYYCITMLKWNKICFSEFVIIKHHFIRLGLNCFSGLSYFIYLDADDGELYSSSVALLWELTRL